MMIKNSKKFADNLFNQLSFPVFIGVFMADSKLFPSFFVSNIILTDHGGSKWVFSCLFVHSRSFFLLELHLNLEAQHGWQGYFTSVTKSSAVAKDASPDMALDVYSGLLDIVAGVPSECVEVEWIFL